MYVIISPLNDINVRHILNHKSKSINKIIFLKLEYLEDRKESLHN